MEIIATFLLIFQMYLIVSNGVDFNYNAMGILTIFILIIDMIYLIKNKRLSFTFRTFVKWLKGENISHEEISDSIIIVRQVLVVNYFIGLCFFVISPICDIFRVWIPYHLIFYSVQLVILFNGIILSPCYIALKRKYQALMNKS